MLDSKVASVLILTGSIFLGEAAFALTTFCSRFFQGHLIMLREERAKEDMIPGIWKLSHGNWVSI